MAGHVPHHRGAAGKNGGAAGAGLRPVLLLPDAGPGPGGPGGAARAPGHELHGPAGGSGAEAGPGSRPPDRRGQRRQAAQMSAGHRRGAQQREGPCVEVQVGPGPRAGALRPDGQVAGRKGVPAPALYRPGGDDRGLRLRHPALRHKKTSLESGPVPHVRRKPRPPAPRRPRGRPGGGLDGPGGGGAGAALRHAGVRRRRGRVPHRRGSRGGGGGQHPHLLRHLRLGLHGDGPPAGGRGRHDRRHRGGPGGPVQLLRRDGDRREVPGVGQGPPGFGRDRGLPGEAGGDRRSGGGVRQPLRLPHRDGGAVPAGVRRRHLHPLAPRQPVPLRGPGGGGDVLQHPPGHRQAGPHPGGAGGGVLPSALDAGVPGEEGAHLGPGPVRRRRGPVRRDGPDARRRVRPDRRNRGQPPERGQRGGGGGDGRGPGRRAGSGCGGGADPPGGGLYAQPRQPGGLRPPVRRLPAAVRRQPGPLPCPERIEKGRAP